MQRRWIFPSSSQDAAITRLQLQLGLPEFVARLLLNHGFTDPASAQDFLSPRLRNLSDPFLLPDMALATARIAEGVRKKQRIVLYGDYDVDGVASLALLHRVLTQLGGQVECFLPHRIDEGYGLSLSGIERCFEEYSPELLIAIDCGTTSVTEVDEINRRGTDVIILDHHEPAAKRPDCIALVNPKLGSDFHYLCSGGVVFKTVHALLKQWPDHRLDLKNYLDIVALATVSDLVPLQGENRIFVHRGLLQMAQTQWPGLRALMDVADVRAPISGPDIGFRLGPRINASGRLGTARESLRLLLTDDYAEARRLAASLDHQNRERQTVERAVAQEVETWVGQNFDPAAHSCIIAGERDWHHGVLGIVASRIMRRHHRPTLLVGFDDDGLGKGSGRSIEGLSLVAALDDCSGHLEKFGGHEMAAGVTVNHERFSAFQEAFHASTRRRVNEDILTPKLRIDAEISLQDIGLSLIESQSQLEPFGHGNHQPIFATRGITPLAAPRVLKEKHLKFDFHIGRQRLGAIWFQGATQPLPRPPWDVAFTLELNEYNGRSDVQLQIIDLRKSVD